MPVFKSAFSAGFFPVGGISFCATRIALHTEQCLPSVLPGVVSVGATAGSMTSLCPATGSTFCSTSTALQSPQWLPSVNPVSVQVGSLRGSITTFLCLQVSSPVPLKDCIYCTLPAPIR